MKLGMLVSGIFMAAAFAGKCPAQGESPVGAKPQTMNVPIEGFTPLKLKDVSLCRQADVKGQWISEFRARREILSGQFSSGTVTLTVHIKLRNGAEVDIQAPQTRPDGTDYLVLTKGRYKPEDVGSFWITAKTSWPEQATAQKDQGKAAEQPDGANAAKDGLQLKPSELADGTAKVADAMAKLDASAAEINAFLAKETAQQRTDCAALYKATIDKKVGDLTVRESKEVQACSDAGMYPPQ